MLLLAGACALRPASAEAAPAGTPEGLLVEAEAHPSANTFARVAADPEASGGSVVAGDEAWQPVFRMAVDERVPERVTIRVRHRGGAVQLKAKVGGKMAEIKWLWKKPEALEWNTFGTFDKAELGERIEIIRGKADAAVEVDAVVFSDAAGTGGTGGTGGAGGAGAGGGGAAGTGDAGGDDLNRPQSAADAGVTGAAAGGGDTLPPDRADRSVPAESMDLSIDWTRPTGVVSGGHWGVALFSLNNAKNAENAAFRDYLHTASPGLVRVHHAKLADDWSDAAAKRWDRAKIAACLAPLAGLPEGTAVMINLPDWPDWFSKSKAIEPAQYADAERLVVEWVEAVRAACPVPVTHIELFNEFDNTWEKKGRLDELWPLFARTLKAAKRAAPDAKVGGPAMTYANAGWVDACLDAAGEDLDFLTWHNYAAGKPTVPNEAVFAAVDKIDASARRVVETLKERGMEGVETYLDEYNIQWTWKPYERRHANAVGAAMQASTVTRLVDAGVTGATVWHLRGDAYGLIDNAGRMRSTGQLFLLANELLVGDRVGTSTRPPEPGTDDGAAGGSMLEVLAVGRAAGGRSVLFANRGEAAVNLPDPAELLGPDAASAGVAHVLDHRGWTVTPLAELADGVSVAGWSVTILTSEPAGRAPGTEVLPGQDATFSF